MSCKQLILPAAGNEYISPPVETWEEEPQYSFVTPYATHTNVPYSKFDPSGNTFSKILGGGLVSRGT